MGVSIFLQLRLPVSTARVPRPRSLPRVALDGRPGPLGGVPCGDSRHVERPHVPLLGRNNPLSGAL